jgi:hypothetical protein
LELAAHLHNGREGKGRFLNGNKEMAEAVALAASVAGLVGLSGQILQGSLFLRQFLEDIRDAPSEVCDLKDEIELFTLVASDTDRLVKQAGDINGAISISWASYARTLERCRKIVDNLGRELQECAGMAAEGRLRWWRRLRVATRKEALAGYLRRLDRAKGQLLAVQANITQSVSSSSDDP